jgi:hypothetical protein
MSSEVILSSLAAIANEWRTLAVAWHVLAAALLLAIATRRRLSTRFAGCLLVLPLISVSALAWVSGNPFNGAVFAMLGLVLMVIATALPAETVSIAPTIYVVPGVLLVAFGWVYPHFLDAAHWTTYLLGAPLGLLPCPTLSAVIGVTLMIGLFRSAAWRSTLIGAGAVYGMVGIFGLGVSLDVGLLAGAAVLAAAGAATSMRGITFNGSSDAGCQ